MADTDGGLATEDQIANQVQTSSLDSDSIIKGAQQFRAQNFSPRVLEAATNIPGHTREEWDANLDKAAGRKLDPAHHDALWARIPPRGDEALDDDQTYAPDKSMSDTAMRVAGGIAGAAPGIMSKSPIGTLVGAYQGQGLGHKIQEDASQGKPIDWGAVVRAGGTAAGAMVGGQIPGLMSSVGPAVKGLVGLGSSALGSAATGWGFDRLAGEKNDQSATAADDAISGGVGHLIGGADAGLRGAISSPAGKGLGGAVEGMKQFFSRTPDEGLSASKIAHDDPRTEGDLKALSVLNPETFQQLSEAAKQDAAVLPTKYHENAGAREKGVTALSQADEKLAEKKTSMQKDLEKPDEEVPQAYNPQYVSGSDPKYTQNINQGELQKAVDSRNKMQQVKDANAENAKTKQLLPDQISDTEKQQQALAGLGINGIQGDPAPPLGMVHGAALHAARLAAEPKGVFPNRDFFGLRPEPLTTSDRLRSTRILNPTEDMVRPALGSALPGQEGGPLKQFFTSMGSSNYDPSSEALAQFLVQNPGAEHPKKKEVK